MKVPKHLKILLKIKKITKDKITKDQITMDASTANALF